jgi:dethiobiotin synthetase
MKPICCGDRRDAELLLAASGGGLTLDEINPVTLKTPAAPLAAALVEKVNIDIEALLNAFALIQSRVDQVLVEGVGGWLVPIRPDYFVADLAVDMKLSVLVVAQNRAGLPQSYRLDGAKCGGSRAQLRRGCPKRTAFAK